MGDCLSKGRSGSEGAREALEPLAAMASTGDAKSSGATAAGASEDPSTAQYVDPGFHDRLRQDWPEDGDQLHSGGWEMTNKLQQEVSQYIEARGLDVGAARLLDLCCGEGSTGIHLAKLKGWRVEGIDISPSAIEVARARAAAEGVQGLATFTAGSAFDLPYPAGSFDVIFGQDPDALANTRRPDCFSGCYAALRPDGLISFHHHWIPGRGWSEGDLKAYCAASGSDLVSADMYVADLEAAGFAIDLAEDITALASSHLRGQLARMEARVAKEGGQVQPWLKETVAQIDRGYSFGLRVVARKPGASP